MIQRQINSENIRHRLMLEILTEEKLSVAAVAKEFGVSREAIYKHLRHLINQGFVTVSGTGGKKYEVTILADVSAKYDLSSKLEENKIWMDFALPVLKNATKNVLDICEYGFTEIVNNAIDHSEGTLLHVRIQLTAAYIRMSVEDNGIGIFNKVAQALGLADPRESIQELYKGKFTTDPTRHSGEGIFFSSRMFNMFHIFSGGLTYFFKSGDKEFDGDWVVQVPKANFLGTTVEMTLLIPPMHTRSEIFDKYASETNDYMFSRTHVPLQMSMLEGNLVSRSQAKRVLARFDRFEEVMLDFKGVQSVGQSFADEIFRVFVVQHPNTKIIAINTNEEVTRMINRAKSGLEN